MLLRKKLDSAWGMLLPCSLVLLLDLTYDQWRLLIVLALLMTLVMLYHRRLRHYLLLPSCVVVTGAIAAMLVRFHGL